MNKTYDTLIFNVTEHSNMNPGCDYNAFAEALEEAGYTVEGANEKGIKMYVSNIDEDEFDNIANQYGIDDALAFVSGNADLDECDNIEEDVECLDGECNEELIDDADYFDEFIEEDFEDPFNADDIAAAGDFDDNFDEDDELMDLDGVDGADLGWEGEISGFDEDIDMAFESRKSNSKRNMLSESQKARVRKYLTEKRKGCCPPKRQLNEEIIPLRNPDRISVFGREFIDSYPGTKLYPLATSVGRQSADKDEFLYNLSRTLFVDEFGEDEELFDADPERVMDIVYNAHPELFEKRKGYGSHNHLNEYEYTIDLDNMPDNMSGTGYSTKVQNNETPLLILDPNIQKTISASIWKKGVIPASIDESELWLNTEAIRNGIDMIFDNFPGGYEKMAAMIINDFDNIPAEDDYDTFTIDDAIRHYVATNKYLKHCVNNTQGVYIANVLENSVFAKYLLNVATYFANVCIKMKVPSTLQHLVNYLFGINSLLRKKISNINPDAANKLINLEHLKEVRSNTNRYKAVVYNTIVAPACEVVDIAMFRPKLFESRKTVAKRTSNNLISLAEALKAFDEKDQKKLDKTKASIDDILKAVKGQSIGEREAREAFDKLKKEQNAIKKIKKSEDKNFSVLDVPGVTKAIKAMIAADPAKADAIKKFRDSLTEQVVNSLVNKKKSLHESATIRGEKMNTIPYKKLQSEFKSLLQKKEALTESLKNADINSKEGKKVKDTLNMCNRALTIIDEELSYRQIAANVFKRLNEEEGQKEETSTSSADETSMDDLAAMFGSSEVPSDDESKEDENKEGDDAAGDDESDEEMEEVELARVVIEMTTKKDAEQLMDLCKEAGIPEDAMEIQIGDEEDESDEEKADEDSEDTSDIEEPAEDEEKADEEKSEDTNESMHYNALRRLFEADEEAEGDDTVDDAEGESNDESSEDRAAEGDGESDEAEEGAIKFVLTNTDYVDELGKVLADEYGISSEEFEEMIGGEVVDADEAEGDEDTEKSDDKEDEADDEAEGDEIDAADIFGNM